MGGQEAEPEPEPPTPAEIVEEPLPAQLREILQQPGAKAQLLSVTAAFAAATWSGPYPPPDLLRGYEDVLPGAADRIMTMAESQQAHRHHLENVSVEGGSKRAWWGLWLGFAISLVVLGLGTAIILTGHTWEGATVMSVDVVALAGVFVYGRREQRRERETKDAQTQLPAAQPGQPAKRDG
jgi:uncharacterized membrane protein